MRTFKRGEKSKLSEISPDVFTVGISMSTANNAVFDISCFGVDAAGKLSNDAYFVFFNQRNSPRTRSWLKALAAAISRTSPSTCSAFPRSSTSWFSPQRSTAPELCLTSPAVISD